MKLPFVKRSEYDDLENRYRREVEHNLDLKQQLSRICNENTRLMNESTELLKSMTDQLKVYKVYKEHFDMADEPSEDLKARILADVEVQRAKHEAEWYKHLWESSHNDGRLLNATATIMTGQIIPAWW